LLGGRKCCLSNRRTLKDIRDRRFRTCQASDMFASHRRGAIPDLAVEPLSEELRAIGVATAIILAEERQAAGRKQVVPASGFQNPASASGLRSASRSDSHFSLSVIFFVTRVDATMKARPSPASPLHNPLPPTNIRLSLLRFLLPQLPSVWPCVQIVSRAGASALGLSASQAACHPSPTRAWESQFPAWLRAALGWNTNAQGDTTWCGRFVWRGWLAPACCCHR
jgi:hypothetical protein